MLDADAIDDVDYTGGQTLLELVKELQARDMVVAVAEASASVRRELDRVGITDRLGSERFYATVEDAHDAFRASGEAS